MIVDRKTIHTHAVAGALVACALFASQAGAATIVINNINAAGVGYNDPTPVKPVGGNPGTTLGEQRLFATEYAASLWAAQLTSDAVIRIRAQFTAQTCTATTGTLGSAGPLGSFRNFPQAPFQDTWYPTALRNKLVGSEATAGTDQLQINFNVNLGQPNCLPNSGFYLGIDNNPPANTQNLVAVLLHEFGHGLGFTVGPTNGQTGVRNAGSPSVWERFMVDNATGLSWFQMTTDAERAASAIGGNRLVWAGANVTAGVPSVLRQGVAGATISGPAAGAAAGVIPVGEAAWGAPLTTTAVTGELMPVADQVGGTGPGCEAFNPANTAAVVGRIALISRGVCPFTQKVKNAQNAGAIGVLIQDNVQEVGAPSALGGSDPTVTIPAVKIFLSDGNALREVLRRRSRSGSGVFVALGLFGTQYAGADALGRIKLYTPSPFIGGSSVSHYDTSAFRNQLMEPNATPGLTQSVQPPEDLTLPLFKDIGW